MLFYLFITFQILYSVSCSISCYDASFDTNSFNYIVTADHFPTELYNSSLKANAISCYFVVLWQKDPDNTKIALIADTSAEPILTDHQLQVTIGYENGGSIPNGGKQIMYQCNTNQCNSLKQLKLLLSSLIVNEDLHELAYLLNPVKPFHGEWCHRASNATFVPCDNTVPVSLCTQCELIGMMNQTGTELCTTCSTQYPYKSVLSYIKTFNMIDRTYYTNWMIICGRENCNTPAIGDSIREKSYIHFDFNKFFNNEIYP